MKGILSRMTPTRPSITNDEDDFNVEYSFAMEYHGPPVTYDLPRAVPINIERIPTAAVVCKTSQSDKLSFPVVQPLLTSDPVNKKLPKELNLDSGKISSPTSVIALELRGRDSHDCELSSESYSSGKLGFSNDRDQSSDLSNAVGGYRVHSSELSGKIESSGTLGFSNSHEESNESSGNSGSPSELVSSNDCKESAVGFINDVNLPRCCSSEPVLSSQFLSSEISSCKADDCDSLPPLANRTSMVTFEDSSHVKPEIIQDNREPEMKVRKGSCYRCFKGNRFTEKEVCIVCNKKYCCDCLLRAMGSMPEGRKCVTCIGDSIDESKRGNLGKCSRMLKRLLNELEIRQIMTAEKMCEVNQVQPDHVYINGKRLCHEELILLQSCSNPPNKLKPGSYWYDKVSGFWGKEGDKPCQIISPNLNVGGPIMSNASNGNTQIFINGREITKVERWMLQFAEVQCAGKPQFWVNADGSYQEEGQKNIKGNIWGKAGSKLICAVLSLPVPPKEPNPSEREGNNMVSRAVLDYLEQRTLQKLLLVGYNGSGTSTIFKQAKIVYDISFSKDERQNIKLMIQSNVYKYLGILLEGRELFEEESLTEMRRKQCLGQSGALGNADESDNKTIYSIGPRLKAFSDWLLKVVASGNLEAIFPAATREYAPLVEELWKDAAIQATYNRRNELMLPTVASYFLERVVDVSMLDYEPTDMDILYAEGITMSNGLACIEFSLPQSKDDDSDDGAKHHNSLLRYQLIRVHPRGLGENCKWLEMFEDVRIVMFCVSLSDYDQLCDDGSGTVKNKMLASRRLFESIATHPSFHQKDFLLILNKFDLLEKKIENVPLTECDWFDDFNPVISRHNASSINSSPSLGQQAFEYIAVKFKRHFFSLTGRKLYVSQMNALESDTVDETLKYAREILKWYEEREVFSISESTYSNEESSPTY